jgi:hypothetical protein
MNNFKHTTIKLQEMLKEVIAELDWVGKTYEDLPRAKQLVIKKLQEGLPVLGDGEYERGYNTARAQAINIVSGIFVNE